MRFENYPKLIAGPGYYACPLCSRQVDNVGRGSGFRKAGLREHVAACFEKKLAAQGLAVGRWSDKHQAHRIVRLRTNTRVRRELDRYIKTLRANRSSVSRVTLEVTERYARRCLGLRAAHPLKYKGYSLHCIGSKQWRLNNHHQPTTSEG